MPSTPTVPDWWCPNCNQSVQPTSRLALSACLLGFGIWFVGGIALVSVTGWSAFGLVCLIAGIIVARTWGPRSYQCPICRTQQMQRQKPTVSD